VVLTAATTHASWRVGGKRPESGLIIEIWGKAIHIQVDQQVFFLCASSIQINSGRG
jgi:hypothetical protein